MPSTKPAPFTPKIPLRHGKPDPTWGGKYCGRKKANRPRPPGAHPQSSEYCRNPAGMRTDHVGSGWCWLHGGKAQNLDPTPGKGPNARISGGKNGVHRSRINRHTGTIDQGIARDHPYAHIVHHRLADKWDTLMKLEYDVMDLVPEANLLRTMAVDFINRYEEFTEQLEAWYADQDGSTKPRRILDISDASRIIESVSKVVERIHKIRSEGAITLETFRRVVEAMGIAVAKFVGDPVTLRAIEHEWNSIAVDARRPDPVPVIETRALPGVDEEWEALPDEDDPPQA